MKNTKLWIFLMTVIASLLFPVYLSAKTSTEPEIIVTMKDPQGEIQVYTNKEEIKFKGVKRELPLGDQEWRKSLCRNKTADEQLSFAEAQLELDTVINELNSLSKPRELSEYQKDFLSTIPPCVPYITKLRTIVRILKGYDLIEISYK